MSGKGIILSPVLPCRGKNRNFWVDEMLFQTIELKKNKCSAKILEIIQINEYNGECKRGGRTWSI